MLVSEAFHNINQLLDQEVVSTLRTMETRS